MAQFTVVFTDGGSYLVTAPDKYAAIDEKTGERATLARSFSRMSTEFQPHPYGGQPHQKH